MLNDKKIYCEDMYAKQQPKGFDDVTLYHGINAFFAAKSYRSSFLGVYKSPKWQICTSTKPLGMLGVTVRGRVLIASNFDLFSGIDRDNNNKRYFDKRDIDNLVYDYKDLLLHEDDNEENNEIVIDNTVVTGVWITSDASDKLKELAKELADTYDLPLLEVGESIFA